MNLFLKFLFDLTLNDLRDITNSLAGSPLDINDINDYQFIKSIINELKEKSGFKGENDYNNEEENEEENNEINQQYNDIELIKLIIPSINDKLNGKTIEEFKEILINEVSSKISNNLVSEKQRLYNQNQKMKNYSKQHIFWKLGKPTLRRYL